ncbi:TonB-dependent receptor [Novosphingobium sp. RD2P27]|uniref:TonB-dependent receptor n=1 Tax=Novosphingobium kalidii TaxID=3230299 RepID=A0ABV2D3B7_9SPHN
MSEPVTPDERSTAGSEGVSAGEIIVVATRRASRLSEVPVAVSVISAEALRNTGATDIRELTQVVPSLLVSSTTSEAAGGSARIRGVGTVGDNPGLESSVATFIDGVYRNRAGVALTELGPIEQIEFLRGPQGTLFGRNASAGIISITTATPKDVFGGFAESSYGNFNYHRIAAGITGPIGESGVDYRLDGVYNHRDGFVKDVISNRRVNGRDRYLLRGKLRYAPTDALSVLLIGDYSRQDEECCAATFLPAVDRTRQPDGSFLVTPSSIALLERRFTSVVAGAGNGIITDDTYGRRAAITPGRSYRSDVRDWGGSVQIDWNLGGPTLTSITAYRYNRYTNGQDADFNNLDILARPDDGSRFNRFRSFTQELRAQGTLLDGKIDWLVGGYYAHEALTVTDNLVYGADYDRYANVVGASGLAAVSPALGQLFAATGFASLQGFANAFTASQLTALPIAQRDAIARAVAAQVQNVPLSGTGDRDRYRQTDSNYALFTHNIIHVTEKLSLTVGVRHTSDSKTLNASLNSTSPCGTYNDNIARLQGLAASGALGAASGVASGLANQLLAPLAGLTCVVNSVNGEFSGKRKESVWAGTAAASYKPTNGIMIYASASRGYKAGGFNLDRAPFYNPVTRGTVATAGLDLLQFAPEKVDSFEIGTKIGRRGFNLNATGFYQRYKSFQLNTFNGFAFFVTDIRGCKDDLGTSDSDTIVGNSACGNTKSGVTSKGFELEAFLYPAQYFTVSTGLTYSDTRYASDLVGSPDVSGNNSLPRALSLLPGGRLSLSNLYTVTGSAKWRPPVGSLRGLLYGDFRYTSEMNTGSDLFSEKTQASVMIVNARIGVGAQNGSWTVEGWVRNAFDINYIQTAFNAALQGSNTSAAQLSSGQRTTQLFGAFLAEPRTFGLTVRTAL